jgi:enamine deaminase RidA (YjgF/YER057c/UK114 family)
VGQLLQVRVYIRGELGEHMATLGPIFSAFLGDSRPAVTGIGVASLASPSTLVEVEAVATVGKGL